MLSATTTSTSGGFATTFSTILQNATTAFQSVWATIKGTPASAGQISSVPPAPSPAAQQQADKFQLWALGLAAVAVVAALFAMFRGK